MSNSGGTGGGVVGKFRDKFWKWHTKGKMLHIRLNVNNIQRRQQMKRQRHEGKGKAAERERSLGLNSSGITSPAVNHSTGATSWGVEAQHTVTLAVPMCVRECVWAVYKQLSHGIHTVSLVYCKENVWQCFIQLNSLIVRITFKYVSHEMAMCVLWCFHKLGKPAKNVLLFFFF